MVEEGDDKECRRCGDGEGERRELQMSVVVETKAQVPSCAGLRETKLAERRRQSGTCYKCT